MPTKIMSHNTNYKGVGSKKRCKGQPLERRLPPPPKPFVLPELFGCHIPEPINCSYGMAVKSGERAVKFLCTNELCPFEGLMIHEECLQKFEDFLGKTLPNHGTYRYWKQRSGIWERKCQGVVKQHCRCRCQRGFTVLDIDHDANKDRLDRVWREAHGGRHRDAVVDLVHQEPPKNIPVPMGPDHPEYAEWYFKMTGRRVSVASAGMSTSTSSDDEMDDIEMERIRRGFEGFRFRL